MLSSSGRPTVAYIDGAALRHNFATIRARVAPHVRVLTVVKADAYGHDARLVAPLFERAGADAFGVATVEEGIEIRSAGVTRPIVVLAGVFGHQIDAVLEHRLAVAIVDRAMLREVRTALNGRALDIHLKIDTGMGRLGVTADDLPAMLNDLRNMPAVRVAGIFSHFANSDGGNAEIFAFQLQQFEHALAAARQAGIAPGHVHLANSAAAIAHPESHFTMVRPGVALYGVPPMAQCPINLIPAMRLTSRIVQLKSVPAERPLSYGQTFVTRRPSRIATIALGYADGYDRRLSNRAQVLVRGQRAPVVGTVCMDLTLVDVTDVSGVQPYDEVVLWGRQGDAAIGIDEVGAWQGAIPYEVLTRLGKRVPRVLEHERVEAEP